MKATVTGGAGFIGSHVVDALVDQGAEVVVLDDLSTGHEDNVNPRAELLVASITDSEMVAKAVAGSDLVVHLAAARAVLASVERPVETDRINVGGGLNVLDAARQAGVRRLVAASSSSVYGGADQLPTPETYPVNPKSPYAVSKLTSEHYARVFTELYGIETVSLRFFNVYGPRQRPDSRYAAVIPLFIRAISENRSPEVHGDGQQSRDFTFITDTVAAVLLAASEPAERCSGRVYNVAGGNRYTLLDVLGILEDQIGNRPARNHVETRAGDVRHSQADISAAMRDLSFQPQVDLRQGLERTVAWAGVGVASA